LAVVLCRGYNPLVVPLLVGWRRLICRPAKKKSKVTYVTPCGRSLRYANPGGKTFTLLFANDALKIVKFL
jgi:hypothetical protein